VDECSGPEKLIDMLRWSWEVDNIFMLCSRFGVTLVAA